MAITTKAVAPEADTSVVLELFNYKRYVRVDTLYEKGVPYRFTAAQALILMDEVDEVTGTPVWKRYKSPQQRQVVVREVQPQDMTAQKVVAPDMSESTDPSKRIEIGDDSDLAGLLPNDEEAHSV